jgi:hypothetical protein
VLGGWLEVTRLARVAAARRRDAASFAASEAAARKYARRYAQEAQAALRQAEALRPSDARGAQEMRRAASFAGSLADRYRRTADYWAVKSRRYGRAARTPWLAVAPDPPPPR